MLRERANSPRVVGERKLTLRLATQRPDSFSDCDRQGLLGKRDDTCSFGKIVLMFGKGFVLLTTLSVQRLKPYFENLIS
jgi:hypothetical protein